MYRAEANEAGHEAHGREALDQLLESAIMKPFYAFLLWSTQFELAIALSTGRNPAHIERLQQEESKWQHALLMIEMNGD